MLGLPNKDFKAVVIKMLQQAIMDMHTPDEKIKCLCKKQMARGGKSRNFRTVKDSNQNKQKLMQVVPCQSLEKASDKR